MKTTRRPSLNDMRAFEAVARLGSMRAAADALALTHGAVSRRVAKLSDDLGLELFEPAGRGLRLTAEGQALASAMGRALALINDTIDSLRDRDAKRPVVLSCERSVAMRWLIPGCPPSRTATRRSSCIYRSAAGRWISRATSVAGAAPAGLPRESRLARHAADARKHGAGHDAGTAARLRGRRLRGAGLAHRPAAWDDWLGRQPGRAARATRYLDHHFLIVEAAAAGLGVALCPRILALDDLRSGRLAAPLGFTPDGSEYGLIEPKTVPPGAAPAWRR